MYTTTDNNNKTSGSSHELNLFNIENLKPVLIAAAVPKLEPKPPLITADRFHVEGCLTSKISESLIPTPMATATTTKEFFLERFGTSHESSATNNNSCRPSESIGLLPSSMSVTSLLLPTSMSMGLRPTLNLPSDNSSVGNFNVNGFQFWGASNSSNNNSTSNSSGSIELQSSSSGAFFENSVFSWNNR
ncbi:hypothetical protein NE237_000350 [Protea cynaroides]|uniref:Uncharacterized protein n=1 Tax=Protea cynaroides TaxID=273540 RepID=A0A9Q0KRD8_9MAGN|nr:hypothetical protein NE237_000350 [Protea cynaroides]